MSNVLKGIFPVIPTPFTDNKEIDYDSLRNVIHFLLDAGAHGFLSTAMSSEFYTLSDEEHYKIVETTMKEVDGKVPVVVGICSRSTKHGIEYAKHAQDHGAAGLNFTTPIIESVVFKVPFDAAREYTEGINNAIDIPIFIQNSPLLGAPLSPAQILMLARDYENVQYAKEEGVNAQQNISIILDLAKKEKPGTFSGVFSGAGFTIISDFKRGVNGCMITPQFADLYVKLWNMFNEGKVTECEEIHRLMAPALLMENIYWESISKYVLKKRGIIKSDAVRATISIYDEANRRETDLVMKPIEHLLMKA